MDLMLVYEAHGLDQSMPKKMVTVNLPEAFVLAVERRVALGEFCSRSEALRQMITEFVTSEIAFVEQLDREEEAE